MSWSINLIGSVDKLSSELDRLSRESYTGNSKEEYDTALPHLKALLAMNVDKKNTKLVKLEASGHAEFREWNGKKEVTYSNCSVKIEPTYSQFLV